MSESLFNDEMLRKVATDLKTKRTPLERMVLSDDEVPGLRAMVLKDGSINFEASYRFGDMRRSLPLGNTLELSVADARKITACIKNLAASGIDVQSDMRTRVLNELKRDVGLTA